MNQSENPENFERDVNAFEERVKTAESFDELFGAIRDAGGVIESSQETITLEKFIEILEPTRRAISEAESISSEATDNFPVLDYITRAHGLRDKVKELLIKERADKKRELEE